MTYMKDMKETQTAGENVYQYLHNSIMGLQVKPGQTINIGELSTFLNVSRSPIRDALIQLAKDGLVTTTPQKGTIVSKIDIQRVRDERFLRACVETRVLEEFIECFQMHHIQELEGALARQYQAAEQKDLRAFLRADDDFHSVAFHATNHHYSLHTILNMSSHYYRTRLLSLSLRNVSDENLQQHQELMSIIRNKDRDAIRRMINSHVVEKQEEEIAMIRRYPDLFTGVDEIDVTHLKIWEDDFLLTV